MLLFVFMYTYIYTSKLLLTPIVEIYSSSKDIREEKRKTVGALFNVTALQYLVFLTTCISSDKCNFQLLQLVSFLFRGCSRWMTLTAAKLILMYYDQEQAYNDSHLLNLGP